MSDDGGSTWTTSQLPPMFGTVALVASPDLHTFCDETFTDTTPTTQQVFCSSDDGQTWRQRPALQIPDIIKDRLTGGNLPGTTGQIFGVMNDGTVLGDGPYGPSPLLNGIGPQTLYVLAPDAQSWHAVEQMPGNYYNPGDDALFGDTLWDFINGDGTTSSTSTYP